MLITREYSEFLIHAADVEGLCNGIDEDLVKALGEWVSIPTTYAGGGRCKCYCIVCLYHVLIQMIALDDLKLVDKLSNGKVDLTFGR
jgi:phosphoribosylformimino-5-aminoimidazole carboxamide ribotide isomerase